MPRSQAQLDNLKKGKATQFKNGDEAARAAGRKGGKASVAKQRRNRSMNEMFRLMAKMPVKEGEMFDPDEASSLNDLAGQNMTAGETMGAQLFLKAMKGDAKAAAIVYPVLSEDNGDGESDRQKALGIAWQRFWWDISPAFSNIAGDVFRHNHTHYTGKGGRGSTKSTFVSLCGVLIIMQNEDVHGLVLRKVANTLRDSVLAQYEWAINELGVAEFWTVKKSPPELTFKPTGQKILFRGADDPGKIKSVKVPFGYIAFTHFEELDQFAGREETRNILQSTMRGGEVYWNFETFNPPITNTNWANKDVVEERADRLVFSSTYLDVPREWLGEQFIDEAEHLKEVNERAYQHEYLGIPVGTGGNVFENLVLRDITDEEVRQFDRIYQGQDFGWYPDPAAFIRLHYDSNREIIYLIDEIYVNKTPNQELVELIKEKGYNDNTITCDSAEPKSIADMRACGLDAKKAIKGPDSVSYGMKWLQKRKIVIDKRRTPNAYREFTEYEYERDRDNNVISGYPDANNHLIDATRYALERVFGKYRSIG